MPGLNGQARLDYFRELARQEIERNPPPPASPELVAKLRAIFTGAGADAAPQSRGPHQAA